MKKALIVGLALLVSGCSMLPPKKTDFYKNGRLVKTFVGRGVWDANEWFGTYKIWTSNGNSYYQYRCLDCEVVETRLDKR